MLIQFIKDLDIFIIFYNLPIAENTFIVFF